MYIYVLIHIFTHGIYIHDIVIFKASAIQCYQCDSNEDVTCPSHTSFDASINAFVDCNSFEAHVPGPFCMKIYQESPGCKFLFIFFSQHAILF